MFFPDLVLYHLGQAQSPPAGMLSITAYLTDFILSYIPIILFISFTAMSQSVIAALICLLVYFLFFLPSAK
jgi:hypothetical protein